MGSEAFHPDYSERQDATQRRSEVELPDGGPFHRLADLGLAHLKSPRVIAGAQACLPCPVLLCYMSKDQEVVIHVRLADFAVAPTYQQLRGEEC
jgi:hypothetical protein